jgi:hypothetical protein
MLLEMLLPGIAAEALLGIVDCELPCCKLDDGDDSLERSDETFIGYAAGVD